MNDVARITDRFRFPSKPGFPILPAVPRVLTFLLTLLLSLIGAGSFVVTKVNANEETTTAAWLSGELSAYKVVRAYDDRGRLESVAVHRNGAAVHAIEPAYTGRSDEISGMSAAGFSAVVTRDAVGRHVTGFERGPVTQRWTRGTAGRITAADTNGTVNGAPAFSYTGFDTRGRRETVVTSKGVWTYGYRGGADGDGQLVSATSTGNHLGNFAYGVDGIGRRDFGGNQQDPLNRFLAMRHPQAPRKLFLSADPDAQLFAAQGVGAPAQLTPDIDGAWIYEVNHPGAAGGWVPWHVRGVLEDEGDPGANPDAVAEFSGHLWFPPATENLTYDDDGNRESSSLWDYGWDGRNRLVRARTKTWDSAPEGWDLKFDYDAEGRRFRKTVTRYADGEPVERKLIHFVWDGWDLLFERHEDGNGNPLLERRYVWGPDISGGAAGGAGGLLLFRETRGRTTADYYPLYDGTGHVVGLTNSAGNLVAEYWWGPFGELIEAKGEMAQANPWRYATKYYDAETGLYYFGHRYYDPVTGQWMSREPLGEDASLNLNIYCHNDPVNKVDVLGLREREIVDPNSATRFKVVNGIMHVHLLTKRIGFWDGFLGHRDRSIIGGRYSPVSENRFRLPGFAEVDEKGGRLTPGAEVVAEASRIAEERYHLSTHTKFAPVALVGLGTLPFVGPAVAEGGLRTAALQASNWFLTRPAAGLIAADLTYTAGEMVMGVDGPGMLVTPADGMKVIPKAASYADELFEEMRALEAGWPTVMANLRASGAPLNMAAKGGSRLPFNLWPSRTKGIMAEIGSDGIVTMVIEAGAGSPMRGTEMFAQMMKHFGSNVKGIRGCWHYGDNLAAVNKLTSEGMSLSEAAMHTRTAQMAAAHGFRTVRVLGAEGASGTYRSVNVIFE